MPRSDSGLLVGLIHDHLRVIGMSFKTCLRARLNVYRVDQILKWALRCVVTMIKAKGDMLTSSVLI